MNDYFLNENTNHLGAFALSLLCTETEWLVNCVRCLKPLPHSEHLYGRSSLCIFMWLSSFLRVVVLYSLQTFATFQILTTIKTLIHLKSWLVHYTNFLIYTISCMVYWEEVFGFIIHPPHLQKIIRKKHP